MDKKHGAKTQMDLSGGKNKQINSKSNVSSERSGVYKHQQHLCAVSRSVMG
jgi:hypothetical protein